MTHNTKKLGLTSREVERLRAQYGFNSIEEKKISPLLSFLKKFTNPITIMIEIAFVLSLLAHKIEDSFIILALLAVNIGVELWQEHKTSHALEALKKNLALKATVLRDGRFVMLPARELVPGDVVKIILGDIVPADVEILDDEMVLVDQSSITGESLPVEKKKGDVLYASSIVQRGSFLARVQKIGEATFIGTSAHLVAMAEKQEKSHFQEAIFRIGKFLAILAGILIVIVVVIFLIQGKPLLDIVQFSLILAVASIPVALPAVLSVTMAIGAAALSREKAIVSNFKSVEELAGVDMLCVDKTGTLTKNELTIAEPKTYHQFSLKDLFVYAYYASEKEHEDAIAHALKGYAQKHGFLKKVDEHDVVRFVAFTPETKFAQAFIKKNDKEYSILMGAPQVIAEKIAFAKDEYDTLMHDVDSFAQNGFRTLAVAREVGGVIRLVGLIPLYDPPRDDSKTVMEKVQSYGLNIKMITGDNTAIARFIAKLLGISGDIVDAKTFHTTKQSSQLIEDTEIFTEVVPEDKYRIVEALQKDGHFVAMTGDGVNDAPALKKADVGIAVAGASPAAREAADIILLTPGLRVIQSAIEHTRIIFNRMQSYAIFRIAETIRIIFFIVLSVVIFGFSPLPAIMIVLLALLNDIPVMAIAYDNASINKKPTRWHLRETLSISSVLGATGLIASFLVLFVLLKTHFVQQFIGQDITQAVMYTILFLKLDVSGHSTLYTTRTLEKHFWKRPFPSLKFFIPAFGSRIIGTVLAYFGIFMAPVSIATIVAIWIYSTVWFLINDFVKVQTYKILRRRKVHKIS